MKRGISQTCHLFFSTLSNPTRLAIIETLRNEPKNVTEIAQALKQEQSMISHNLRPLVRCGFVSVERKWRERVYALNMETMGPIFKVIDNHVEKYCPKRGRCLE